MVRRFGKKNVIKTNVFDYNVGLIGESGIGKTTLAIKTCEKLVGEDGYMLLSLGKEDAVDAIADAVFEEVPDWATLKDIKDDIVDNKQEDYKELQVIIYDTMDELFDLAEKEVVRIWNKENPDKKVKTVSSAYGGFQRGEGKVIELVTDLMWELKRVGVNMFSIGHTKRKTKIDPVTLDEYDVLTTNLMAKYFDAIKNKLHVLGVASIDRKINKTVTKDKMTGKSKTHGEVGGEKRIITFRDNNFTIESKSRFDEIIPQIPLDVDEFIKAIEDAIKKEHDKQKNKKSLEEAKVEQKKEKEERVAEELEKIKVAKSVDEERNVELSEQIKLLYGKATTEQKTAIKDIMTEYNITTFAPDHLGEVKTEGLEKIVEVLA